MLIGTRPFVSKKEATAEYVRIRECGIRTPTGRNREFLFHVAHGHPKIKAWLTSHNGTVTNVYIAYRPGDGCRPASKCVHVEMCGTDGLGETMTIGPKPCMDGLFGIKGCETPDDVSNHYHRAKRSDLARQAIKGQRDQYCQQQPVDADGRFTCAGCGVKVARSELDIDHVVLLSSIIGDFDKQFPGASFENNDPLMPQWLQFHQDHCVWQILCRRKCHLGSMAEGGKTAAETSTRAKRKREGTAAPAAAPVLSAEERARIEMNRIAALAKRAA